MVEKPTHKWRLGGGKSRLEIFLYKDEEYVKRLIALPGDTIEIRSGTVYINGDELSEEYIQNRGDFTDGPTKLADDEYYVLGDNREFSRDSHNFGPIKADTIYGRVVLK